MGAMSHHCRKFAQMDDILTDIKVDLRFKTTWRPGGVKVFEPALAHPVTKDCACSVHSPREKHF